MDLSCIILTGGKGSRLGRPKTQVTVGRKTLFQRALCSLEFLKGDIIVVASGNEPLPPLVGYPEYRVVTDIYPDKGPLVGIFTGLSASRTACNLVVAGDMPFLDRGLLSYLVRIADGFDAVIPRPNNMVEPLHAVYARTCLAPIERMIQASNLSVYRLLEMVRVRYVDDDEITRFDPEHLSFFNVNTQADLQRARELAGERDCAESECRART